MLRKKKKIHPEKKSFYLRKLNFITIRLKKFLYFLKRQLFLYFRKGTLHFLSSGLKKKIYPGKILYMFSKESFLNISGTRTLLYFTKRKPRKKSLHFRKRNFFYILENETPQKIFIFPETKFSYIFLKMFFLYCRKGIFRKPWHI